VHPGCLARHPPPKGYADSPLYPFALVVPRHPTIQKDSALPLELVGLHRDKNLECLHLHLEAWKAEKTVVRTFCCPDNSKRNLI